MPERRLYDVECIEALYARCDELQENLDGRDRFIVNSGLWNDFLLAIKNE